MYNETHTFFLSPKERILSSVTEILRNIKDSSCLDGDCLQLGCCAAELIKCSPQDALRYASNRVLWNKQPLFHAVLLEEIARAEKDSNKKSKLECHAVYCYANAGALQPAIRCAERAIQQTNSGCLTEEANKSTNQEVLPIFSAIVFEAKARHIESSGCAHPDLSVFYQKASYFYAMAQQVSQAKKCIKKWLSLASEQEYSCLYREADDSSHHDKNPLYCGLIYEILGTHFLNSPKYGYGSRADLYRDQGNLVILYGRALQFYDKARQVEPLKTLVRAFSFIDESGHELYAMLKRDPGTQSSRPLMTAVFHEVYENFQLASYWYQRAGYPSEASRCGQNGRDVQESFTTSNSSLVHCR